MNNIHLILQGKGGVGKSLIAVLLAQYLQSKGEKIICADTDPVNKTFTMYPSLDVAHIEIAEKGNVIQAKFDNLMNMILENDSDFIVDNGASTFMPLTRYLAENDVYQVMSESGKKIYIHSVLTGGQALNDTYNGFADLLSKVNQFAKIVVWENEFWGKVLYEGSHRITSTKLYKEADKDKKIAGIVNIVDRSQSDTFVGDMKKMTSKNMTLNDVMNSTEFTLWEKNRLKKLVEAVFAELDKVNW